MTSRPSLPPGPESLKRVTDSQKAANDRLEKTLGEPPVVVTNAHRLVCSRELWALHISRGYVHMDQTVTEWERMAREGREG